MLIVPIGRHKGALQQHAWVTYAVVVLNVVFFLIFCTGATDRDRGELVRGWRSMITYLRERPYLRPPVLAAALLPDNLRARTPRPDPAVDEWRVMREQAILDGMAADVRLRYEEVDDVRLAYVPAVGATHTIFTSMFLHAGLLHLAGNMIFLLAVAPFVEDAFGRVAFAVLYLTGGVMATIGFAARFPDLVTPLVGASGAVAAIMGAYLLRFALSRLEFFVIPILFLPMWHFRFSAPALVVLPIWFLEQLVSIPSEGDSGVAVTAHVTGFVYGLAFAVVLRVARVGRKDLQPAKAKAPPPEESDPRLDLAMEAVGRGDEESARREINALLAEKPAHAGGLRLALEMSLSRGDRAAADPYAARLLAAYAAARKSHEARQLILELKDAPLPQFLARAAAHAERSGDRPLALALYERVSHTDATAEVIPSLVKLATLRRSKGDLPGAREALRRALEHPGCSPEWRRRIDTALAGLAGG